jgi:CheY-like chemotaxis protein
MAFDLNSLIGQTCTIPAGEVIGSAPVVLVIDDSEDCTQLAVSLLEQLGCRCITAATATEGLSAAVAYAPDVILLDIVLPDYSGLELLSHFKRQIQTINTPVIAVTALASAADRERCLISGCVGCLVKPYMIQDFKDILRWQLPTKSMVARSHLLTEDHRATA